MDNIDKCPECGAGVEHHHANVLGDPSEYGEPDDVEDDTIPDTGEEDDIREYNQQLQAMYARGYRAGRIAGYARTHTERTTRMNEPWPTEPVRRMIYEAGIREGRRQIEKELEQLFAHFRPRGMQAMP